MPAKYNYLKSAEVIGLSTLASRVLGMIRDMAMASLFGAGMVLDAFVLAFTIPNLFRRFLGEGALSAAFIPAFTEVLDKEGEEKARSLVSQSGTLLFSLLVFLVLAGVVLCLIPIFFFDMGPKNLLALRLSALMMPFLHLICWTAFLGAILNALHHFWSPAFAPALFNMVWIGGIFLLRPFFGTDRVVWTYVMAVTVLIGGVFQILLQIPFLQSRQMNFSFDFHFDLKDSSLRKIFTNLVPVLFSAAVVQINTLMDSVIAWFMIPGDGAVTILYMANRLLQFPLSIIGTSLGTVVFPIFTLYAVRGEKNRFAKAVPEALRISFFLALPATLGLVILSKPIISLIYQHNRFDEVAALRTTNVLIAFCSGLCFYILLQIISRAFYSLGDTKTPMRFASWIMIGNILANILIAPFLRELGLAITTAFGAFVNFTMLLYCLQKKASLCWEGIGNFLFKSFLSAVFMSVSVILSSHFLPYPAGIKGRLLAVFIPLLIGMAVYGLSAFFLGIQELKRFFPKKSS